MENMLGIIKENKEVTQMTYLLSKFEYDEQEAKIITEQHFEYQSKNQLMGAISKALKEDPEIEGIAMLKVINQNQT